MEQSKEILKEEKETKNSKARYNFNYGYLYYIAYILIGVYMRTKNINITINIGDFGNFVPAMLFSIAVVAIRWIPFIGLVGFILTLRRENLKDIIMLYFIFTLIVLISTLTIVFIIL